MSKAYVHQDGGDFYIYLDPNCEFIATTWSVHFAVGLSLEKAIIARKCFLEANPQWDVEWPNPFA